MDPENESEETQDFSEAENDLNLINIKHVRRKIFDNGTEADEHPSKEINDNVPEKQLLSDNYISKEQENSVIEPISALDETRNKIFDQLTSIVNSGNHEAGDQNTKFNPKRKTKQIAVIDSDSEDEFNPEMVSQTDGEKGSNTWENHKVSIDNGSSGAPHVVEENQDENLASDSEKQDENTDEAKLKKKPKRIAIIDSDSEDEVNPEISQGEDEKSSNTVENFKVLNDNESNGAPHLGGKKQDDNLDSDSEKHGENSDEPKVKKKPKRIAIIDSDSEAEEPITPHNKSFNDELAMPTTSKEASVFIINEKGNLVAENNSEITQLDAMQKSRFAALCDSESSEDESRYPSTSAESPKKQQKRTKAVRKSTKTSTEKPTGKAMTGKEALQQRQEIRSESQRMLRESRVSLPYHKPKAHSIKEFLQNRPRLSLSMNTNNTPPSVAMKMSVQELEIVTKKLEERGKAVQEFYKSESESDEEQVEAEEPKRINQEVNSKDIIENNGDKDMEIVENGETVINNEEEETLNLDSESKCEERNKESVEDLNLLGGDIDEANSDMSRMEIDADLSQIEEVNHVKENHAVPEALNVNEEMSADIASTELVDEPKEDKAEIENTSNNSCEDASDTVKAQEVPAASLEHPETSSVDQTTNQKEIEESNKLQTDTVIEDFEDSVDFDFNLDGLEDFPEETQNNCPILEKNSETNTEEQHLQRLLKKYEDNPVDECIKSAAPIEDKKVNKMDFLKQFSGSKPSLSGGPDEVIDLDEGMTKPSGIAQLMQRFMKHALTKNVVKHKVQLDIINLTQGEVIKETVAMSVDVDEEPVAIIEKPGVKLKKLRDELQNQMAQRRSELWQQKHQPLSENSNKEPYDGEKSDCGADEDILDDEEEEAELSDIEDEEEEDEYEEEVRKTLEKPRVKSAFVDDEAEETDEDEGDKVSEDEEEVEKTEEAVHEDTNEDTTIKKPLRRILKGFTEDSDDEDDSQSVFHPLVVQKNDERDKNTSFTSLNSTDSNDDIIPPNQPRTDKTPHKEPMESSNDILGLQTPIQQLTGLQGFNSGSKFLHQDSPISPFLLPPEPSPFKDKNWNRDLQKKLFSDSSDTFESQGNMDDLAELCSGKFPTQTRAIPRADSACSNNAVDSLATQDVISMCSGSFPDMTQAPKDQYERNFIINEDISEKVGSVMQVNLNSSEEIKSLDDDRLISELLNEEEMELFKKKFESPIADTLSNVNGYEADMEVQGGGRFVSDSSDDEGEGVDESKSKKCTKKLQKRLAFSDDSDSEDEQNEDREEIKLHDDCSDDEFQDDANTNKIIDYDSEENEIELDDQEGKDIQGVPKQKLKPSDFFEKEAELTESDWDSADEDEKGLDALEFEQGDDEVFDENKMRTDLEKIHMRRVLDQDNQEIKILQELLLEDGELHGIGRQRQFRWRNIDGGGAEGDEKDAEIEAYLDEEESEEQWRRARHQREMFLKEKQDKRSILENDDFISINSNSQVLKFGQEAVRKSLSIASAVPENSKATTSSPDIAKPLMMMNTRGSFLARTDTFLSKLAEFTKVATSTTTGGTAKNTKKIVFQAVSTKETGLFGNKRKLESEDKTPKIIKKLRLSSNLTPVLKSVDRKKKLFK